MSQPTSNHFNQQWQLFKLAVQFFTRIPVGDTGEFSDEKLNQANRYFSLVGLLVGAILALCFFVLSSLFPTAVIVVILLIISALLTGAFHEDGLADMADGIGGGYSVEKRLLIMKDSRLGTYGTITLLFSSLLKFTLLVELIRYSSTELVVFSLIFAHGLSRAIAASLIFNTPYVTDLDASKSKPLAQEQSANELLVILAIACLPLLLLPQPLIFSSVLILFSLVLILFRSLFRRWLIARIGGFTGDCLGAAQQITELLIYLMLLGLVFSEPPL